MSFTLKTLFGTTSHAICSVAVFRVKTFTSGLKYKNLHNISDLYIRSSKYKLLLSEKLCRSVCVEKLKSNALFC
jgi:hypothetical protein